jgi:ubiquinone/menaquinone biosynthesis C-methylase UbiE
MAGLDYVHGYSAGEIERLIDQATVLTELLHADTRYPDASTVLEAGCGVGGQTVILAKNSPGARFTSVDISTASLETAKARVTEKGYGNVVFQQGDIYRLPFPDNSFDHVFVCFVLEHLKHPEHALVHLGTKLRPGGTLTVIEGDHGSTFFSPDSRDAWRTIQCLIDLQAQKGGDALIGRRLFPLLTQCRFSDIRVSPRMVYVDSSKPAYVEGFTKKTFIAMVEGVRDQAIDSGIATAESWETGIRHLKRTAEKDGTFCYTFFKAVACKPSATGESRRRRPLGCGKGIGEIGNP